MNSGRVFKPIDITDNLSDEQVTRFATLLAECIERGYGEVTITVSNHHVNKVMILFEEKLPLPKQVT